MTGKDVMKAMGDVIAGSVTVGALLKFIPAIASLLAIFWYAVNLYEKVTGRPFSELFNKDRG